MIGIQLNNSIQVSIGLRYQATLKAPLRQRVMLFRVQVRGAPQSLVLGDERVILKLLDTLCNTQPAAVGQDFTFLTSRQQSNLCPAFPILAAVAAER